MRFTLAEAEASPLLKAVLTFSHSGDDHNHAATGVLPVMGVVTGARLAGRSEFGHATTLGAHRRLSVVADHLVGERNRR